jgi:hypothetical protein
MYISTDYNVVRSTCNCGTIVKIMVYIKNGVVTYSLVDIRKLTESTMGNV